MDTHVHHDRPRLRHRVELSPHQGIEAEIIEPASDQHRAAEPGGSDPVNGHAAGRFECGEIGARVVVALPAGDGVHVIAEAGQMEGKVADELAGGGFVRKEEPVEEHKGGDHEGHEREQR